VEGAEVKGLEGRSFLVGGGGSGIGRGACERLAQAGARIAVLDLARDARRLRG
jgi:NAD(P)-dependent dehydrogenase (short-subunit alcohol dehydrogenase family)